MKKTFKPFALFSDNKKIATTIALSCALLGGLGTLTSSYAKSSYSKLDKDQHSAAVFISRAAKKSKLIAVKIIKENPSLNRTMVKLGVNGYFYAQKKNGGYLANPRYLTLVDFTKVSSKNRLFVVDLDTDKVVEATPVAHGMNSGLSYARYFSNSTGAHQSSLGVYLTSKTYFGHHGLSMRLQGLERGINEAAMRRAVVMHSAPYMTQSFIKQYHRAGRSWGCFAVSPAVSKQTITRLKCGSVLFAYAPAEQYDANVAELS